MPGKDTDMDPIAEWTKLECWDNDGKPFLKEVSRLYIIHGNSVMLTLQYVGSGKLKGKTAIVTGMSCFSLNGISLAKAEAEG